MDNEIWFPYTQMKNYQPAIEVVSAEGVNLHLANGQTLIDALASWWCVIYGYNHPEITAAAKAQLDKMSHVMLGDVIHPAAKKLAEKLIQITPTGLNHVFFADSGSVGVEVALKMALQFWHNRKQTQKNKILALTKGYHGDTCGAMSVCEPHTGMHKRFAGIVPTQLFLESPTSGFAPPVKQLQEEIDRLEQTLRDHHNQLAAFIVEPILQGAGGFNIYSPQFLRAAYELGNYILLGLVCAGAAVLFVKLLYAFEDLFDKITKIHYILKPVVGAFFLGLLGIAVVSLLGDSQGGEPLIFGNGYALIGHCIGANSSDGTSSLQLTVWVLLLLFVCKTLATCLTLGSGGSGGVFAPSLFMGAVLGYAFGLLAQQTGWFNGLSPASYSLVGMASVVAATTHAPMAAILILFELTRDYRVILPAMLSATVAMAIAQLLYRDSIYTLKLRRRGVQYEMRANTAILRRLTVKMVMTPNYAVVYDDVPMQEVVKKAAELEVSDFIVTDHEDHYYGVLIATDIRTALLQPEALPLLVTGELARRKVPTVGPSETLDVILDKFSRLEVNRLAVHSEFNDHKFIGMISRSALMRRYQQELQGK